MASVNRAALITKLHRILKKHYKPAPPQGKGTVLENLLYAAVLENALPEQADLAFGLLKERFFDLNEVRVSTVRELAEVLQLLPDPEGAAQRVKQVLQSVFEAHYAFDLEPLKKQNLGAAVKQLEKYQGATPFVIAYVTQSSLGGHAIPINAGGFQSLVVVGVLTEAEAEKKYVPGLERAIPKSKGPEFFSLVHQLGVLMFSSPLSPNLRKILLEIDPECKERLPKRVTKKEEAPAAPPEPPAPPAVKDAPPAAKPAAPAKAEAAKPAKTEAAKPVKAEAAKPAKAAAAAKPAAEAPAKAAKKKPAAEEKPAKKPAPPKKAAPPEKAAKKAPAKKKAPPKKAEPPKKKPSPPKKSPVKGLTKKKPK